MKHWSWGSRDERIRIWIGAEASERSDEGGWVSVGILSLVLPLSLLQSLLTRSYLSSISQERKYLIGNHNPTASNDNAAFLAPILIRYLNALFQHSNDSIWTCCILLESPNGRKVLINAFACWHENTVPEKKDPLAFAQWVWIQTNIDSGSLKEFQIVSISQYFSFSNISLLTLHFASPHLFPAHDQLSTNCHHFYKVYNTPQPSLSNESTSQIDPRPGTN